MRDAHDFLTRLLVTLRLVAPDAEAPPPATAALAARACGLDDWDALVAKLDATRQAVIACWQALQPGEEDDDATE
jgi:[glutamine synthetase] adenylyltransferase / [glutamine synthetase]-adenylyl-L-tyrosine phosphorylase